MIKNNHKPAARHTLIAAILFLLMFSIKTHAQEIEATPYGAILTENNETFAVPDTIFEGEKFTGSAPIVISFSAGVKNASSTLRYEWRLSRDPQLESVELTRFDETTEISFNESGSSYVEMIVTDTETGNSYTSMPFTITVSESKLTMPNAFSPNGDGINDVYKITYESLVSLEAYIFNRWGQELYHMNLSNVDEGWDGTFHGKPVKDGVYFILVKAEGSDGVKYNKKKDINILRGTNNSSSGNIGNE